MSHVFPAAHRAAVAGAIVATIGLAGCSDSTSSPNRAIAPEAASFSQAPPELNDLDGHGHIFHTKEWFEDDAKKNAGKHGGGGGGTGILYHGGQVLQSGTKVAAVYWAGGTIFSGGPAPGTHGNGSGDASLVGYFLNHLGGSSYFNINSSYTDGGGRAIANAVSYTQYWANNTSAPSGTQSVSDSQMLLMLQNGFNSGALSYDANTLYAIFTSGSVNLGGGFGTQYCAYHTHGSVNITGLGTRTVLYAAMPYNAAKLTSCTNGTPPANGDAGADYEVNTLAHEIEETTTDMMANAWFDTRGYENADKCAWTWGSTYTVPGGTGIANIQVGAKHFLVQQNWVNAGSGGCAKAY